jgi:hypothetical protein
MAQKEETEVYRMVEHIANLLIITIMMFVVRTKAITGGMVVTLAEPVVVE